MIPTPECDLPQEPSPIEIVYYTPDEFHVILPKESWIKIGEYVLQMQQWVRAAGPCLRGHGSDVPNPPGGLKQ